MYFTITNIRIPNEQCSHFIYDSLHHPIKAYLIMHFLILKNYIIYNTIIVYKIYVFKIYFLINIIVQNLTRLLIIRKQT